MMTPQEVLKTYQCVDDPIAALLDFTEIAFIQADARAALLDVTEIAFIQADARAELLERIEKLEKALQLETHKVITCGVAAHHPDPTLTRAKKCYAEDWNSPQAEDVRKLRESRDTLKKLVEDIDKSDLLRHHPWDCPALWATPGACTCDCDALQQRINEALEP